MQRPGGASQRRWAVPTGSGLARDASNRGDDGDDDRRQPKASDSHG
jgi:hypothetical protein